jgi:hypothetical protein
MGAHAYRRRWSDNDHNFGPFTYAWSDRYRPFGVELESGKEDHLGNQLRFHAFGHTLIVHLPAIIQPHRTKVFPAWDEATTARLGRNWYWDEHRRGFGFSFIEGALHLRYGRQTHDSSTDKSKCYFLPWRSWRHVRRSFYGIAGEHIVTLPDRRLRGLSIEERGKIMDEERAAEVVCPTVSFAFDDFDGERLTATTRIEEREWRLGEGKFKWLSWFHRPKIRRSLDIRFSGETGKRKGSWKGGTIGTGIDMLPGELHEPAFRRYCAENAMEFIG